MLERLKAIFKNRKNSKLSAAETDFDDLMKKVDEDELELDKLETQVRKEFNEIGGGVDEIKRGVDETLQ